MKKAWLVAQKMVSRRLEAAVEGLSSVQNQPPLPP